MPDALQTVLTYLPIPVLIIAAAGSVSGFFSFRPWLRSAIQHFAAGLVFAAVSTGLLPELLKARDLIPTVAGFSLGVLMMLGMKWGCPVFRRVPVANHLRIEPLIGYNQIVRLERISNLDRTKSQTNGS